MSQSGRYTPTISPGTFVETLTGNTGGAVGPSLSNNINVVGDGTIITVTGNPGTNTLEITLSGEVATQYVTDSGTAVPAAEILNITGGFTGLTFEGSGNTVSLTGGTLGVPFGGTDRATLTNHGVLVGAGTSAITQLAVGITGQVLTGVTGSDPVWASPAASSISITGDTGGAITGNAFTFTGGTTGLSFNGSGTTETLLFAGALINNGVVNIGTDATANAINIGTVTNSSGRAISIGNISTFTTVSIQGGNTSNAIFIRSIDGTSTFTAGSNGTVNLGSSGGSGTTNLEAGSGGLGITGGPIFINSSGLLEVGGLVDTSETIQIGSSTSSAHSSFISIGNNLGASSVTISYGSAGLTIAPLTAGAIVTSSVGLVSAANGTSGFVLTSTGSTTAPTFQAPATSSISITGNSGGALTGNAFTFTGGTTGLTFSGAGTTETLTGDLVVANGGTGNTTFTAYSVICAGTTATGPFQNVSGVGSNGQVLTSQGAAALPQWTTISTSPVNYTGVNHAASPYTALSTDYYISADVTAGVVSILLPNAPVTGRTFIVKDKVGLAATSNITVTTVGGAVTIDGATSFVLNTAYESVSVIFNGTSYEVF